MNNNEHVSLFALLLMIRRIFLAYATCLHRVASFGRRPGPMNALTRLHASISPGSLSDCILLGLELSRSAGIFRLSGQRNRPHLENDLQFPASKLRKTQRCTLDNSVAESWNNCNIRVGQLIKLTRSIDKLPAVHFSAYRHGENLRECNSCYCFS